MFKIGDIVKIKNIWWNVFSQYEKMSEFFKMKNWEYDRYPENDDVFKIINKHHHLKYKHTILYYIRNIKNQEEFIAHERGLEIYEEFIKPEEFMV